MADHAAFENETRDRLSRMERELRYWRFGGIFTLALATVVVAAAMDDPPPKELRVETLKIVQRDGKERIVLTAVPGVPDMTFLDPGGQSRLTLDIADDHKPVLRVSETANGKGHLILGIEDGSPMLQLYSTGMGKNGSQSAFRMTRGHSSASSTRMGRFRDDFRDDARGGGPRRCD